MADDASVTVFQGSRAACREFGLVLEARGLAYELREVDGAWMLTVDAAAAPPAREELERYAAERWLAAERSRQRRLPDARVPFAGAAAGAIGYAVTLLVVAYGAGANWFGADWLAVGAVDSESDHPPWWRALTALTLHLDPAHLLGNLLFGVGVGVLCGQLLGPGVAWLSILVAGGLGNFLESWIAPAWHRAAGASTAVFAALGLLAGYAWRQRFTLRERWIYRWTPLIAGVCLLVLLGAGGEHVDVLGHALGFLVGIAQGWLYALAGMPRSRSSGVQWAAGITAFSLLLAAWALALRPYLHLP